MTTSITKLLRNRQTSGKKLNVFRDIYPNREAANVQANRAVRANLTTANEKRRKAKRWYRITTAEYDRVRTNPNADPDFLEYLGDRSIDAGVRLARSRRRYDKVVEDANEVLKKHESWRESYQREVAYRVGNAPQIVAAFNGV